MDCRSYPWVKQPGPSLDRHYGRFLSASLAYLAFAVHVTFADNLTVIGEAASAALLILEFSALVLASSFAFETCDVICRVRHSRPEP